MDKTNEQKKEELMIVAIEFGKQAREHLEEILPLETGHEAREIIQAAIRALEEVRNTIKPIRKEYGVWAEMAELQEEDTRAGFKPQDDFVSKIADRIRAEKQLRAAKEDQHDSEMKEAILRS